MGSIAGSVTWTGCGDSIHAGLVVEPGSCEWTPYVTVGPGSDPSECSSAARRLPDLGDEVSLVWSDETSREGYAAFDLLDVPLSGTPGQLTCLSVIATYAARPSCWDQPVICPQFIVAASEFHALAQAWLGQRVEQPTEPDPASPGTGGGNPTGESPGTDGPLTDPWIPEQAGGASAASLPAIQLSAADQPVARGCRRGRPHIVPRQATNCQRHHRHRRNRHAMRN
jgi:hypothetical protein